MQRAVHPVRAALDVPDSEIRRGRREFRSGTVVEQPGRVGIADVAGVTRGDHDEVDRLVVGGDEDVDRCAERNGIRQLAGACAPHRESEQAHVDQAVGLRYHERHRDPPGVPVEREQPAPGDVVHAKDHSHDNEDPQDQEPVHDRNPLKMGWHGRVASAAKGGVPRRSDMRPRAASASPPADSAPICYPAPPPDTLARTIATASRSEPVLSAAACDRRYRTALRRSTLARCR